VPHWASDKKKFGLRTYNARSETVAKNSVIVQRGKSAIFGLAIMESFYEPSWETGKAIRWRIKRADAEPVAVAFILERFIDKESGEIMFSFSMLTINADNHPIMKHFHKSEDVKRSVVVLSDSDYLSWLHANIVDAKGLLNLAPDGFLLAEEAPR